MWKRAALIAGLAVMSIAFASPAMASTTTPVSMTFTEPLVPAMNSGCPALGLPNGGGCGNGIVLPFGHATETIAFSAACGGDCDLRTVSLSVGSIVMEERASNFTECARCHNENGGPFSGTLTDVIVGGTGVFTGASGTLSGTVKGTGLRVQVKLSGAITLTS
jgi:hypothetical protein